MPWHFRLLVKNEFPTFGRYSPPYVQTPRDAEVVVDGGFADEDVHDTRILLRHGGGSCLGCTFPSVVIFMLVAKELWPLVRWITLHVPGEGLPMRPIRVLRITLFTHTI
jgi:hypothetical protein